VRLGQRLRGAIRPSPVKGPPRIDSPPIRPTGPGLHDHGRNLEQQAAATPGRAFVSVDDAMPPRLESGREGNANHVQTRPDRAAPPGRKSDGRDDVDGLGALGRAVGGRKWPPTRLGPSRGHGGERSAPGLARAPPTTAVQFKHVVRPAFGVAWRGSDAVHGEVDGPRATKSRQIAIGRGTPPTNPPPSMAGHSI